MNLCGDWRKGFVSRALLPTRPNVAGGWTPDTKKVLKFVTSLARGGNGFDPKDHELKYPTPLPFLKAVAKPLIPKDVYILLNSFH